MILQMTRPQIMLSILCLPLGAMFAYQMVAPTADYEVPQVMREPHAALPVNWAPVAAPPAETYAAIDARPAFSPTRKPFTAAPAKEAQSNAPPPAPVASLIGVIIDPQERLALIKTASSPLVVSLTVGASLDGWQISQIEADRVVLRAGTAEQELRLNANRPGPSSNPPSAAMTPPASQ